jgi:outer membrane lipoprotein-sorting protein
VRATWIGIITAVGVSVCAGDDALLQRIWDGVQEAQNKYASGRGTITETRTSALLARPLVFHGKFFAAGMTKFSVEYSGPEPIRVVFNRDYLNVTTGKERPNTEVIQIGDHVRRTQAYFSRGNSLANLKQNFAISAREERAAYEMKLVPKSSRFKKRINYVIVRLSKPGFLLRTLEVDGTSGVNSRFDIQLDALNVAIDEKVFRVYRP